MARAGLVHGRVLRETRAKAMSEQPRAPGSESMMTASLCGVSLMTRPLMAWITEFGKTILLAKADPPSTTMFTLIPVPTAVDGMTCMPSGTPGLPRAAYMIMEL